MLEAKYYRDYRHNYLIIQDNGSLSENIYQRKMVTENKIRGLLCCQERNINGETLLYYEITSRQSFRRVFEGKSIGMKQFRSFFTQVKEVSDELQKYLLDENCLVLLPEYIFQDLETGEYSFLYYPDPEENGFSKFVDFLTENVNNEDMDAVETVYRIAELVRQEQFVVDEVLSWFQEETDAPSFICQEEKEEVPVYLEEKKEERGGIIEALRNFFRKFKRKSETEERNVPPCYVETRESDSKNQETDVGNTVFIPWAESCENKLYSMDRKIKLHIDLARLPLTVGKLAGAVDLVLNETSISRMHAKFSREGSKIYITDLNSTNGTFRNGMRLLPNASELIEPGDEIRLGKLKFIYR